MRDLPYSRTLPPGAPRAEPSPCACCMLRSPHGPLMSAISPLATRQSRQIPLHRRAFHCALPSD